MWKWLSEEISIRRHIQLFRSGLWRVEPPWFIAIWSLTFWKRQRVRFKVWRLTGHHFFWNK
jgi:hypothetical protein